LIFTVPACPAPLEEQITREPRDWALRLNWKKRLVIKIIITVMFFMRIDFDEEQGIDGNKNGNIV
jgi:hypothetical protein